jgi:DNA phosphorothioation-dependent restriction protein DptG
MVTALQQDARRVILGVSWYPDSQTWKESVTRYGAAKAVDVVTEQFSTK